MSIPVTEEHEALAESVSRWAADHCPEAVPQETFDADTDELPAIWEDMANQGWLGIHLPEEHGGVGYGLEELAVVIEQLGRAAVPGPFVPTVLAGELIRRAGSDATKGELLASIADGSRPAAVDLQGGTLSGERTGDGLAVSGTVSPVMSGVTAKSLVLSATVGGEDVWFVVDADDVTATELKSFDGSRREAKVELDGVAVADERVLTGLTTEQVRDLAVTLFAAEAAGITGWTVDIASEYAKVREQFGRPIGQFQGVKHRCANMLVRAEQAMGTAWDAARAAAHDDLTELRQPATVAAAIALESAFENAKDCIQVLGGIGFTWEHAAHMYLKRATAVRAHLGTPAPWRLRATELALSGVRRQLSVDLGEEAEPHRESVRAFLESIKDLDDQAKRNRMADEGYIVPHLPKPWGREADAIEQLVIDEEFRTAGERRPGLGIGAWAVPSIIAYGTEEQKEKYLAPTFRGEMIWCQLFSEPGAGSDLASLSMKAAKVDGGYLLTGQKVWTSGAHVADKGICLARTNRDEDSKHFGITYFLIDMKAEGVDVRPLREITGEALFNEVFLNDVFVPEEDVLGEVDDGWRVARNTLSNERVALSGGSMIGADVEGLLKQVDEDTDPTTLERVGFLLTRGQSIGLLGYRSTLRTLSGTEPGATASVRNLIGSEHGQDVAQLSHELLGPDAATMEDVASMTGRAFLFQRAVTIYGGTSEVQRNIIAERVLGLPRDP